MKLNKLLTALLLCLLMTSVQAWSAEPQYTRAQVDSIVAAEVARQLKDQQIELQIERASNEKYATSLEEQNNRIAVHDWWMTGLYALFAIAVAVFGMAVPYMQNKRYEERLNAIADENKEKIQIEIKKRTDELDAKIKAHDRTINKLVKDAAESKKAAAKSQSEAEESAKQAKASEYFSQAYAEKDLDKQVELYTKAIELKPDYADAYINRGCAYDDKKEYYKAIDDYNKAIALKPDYADAYNNRGCAYDDIKEYDKAIADYTKAIELNPDDAVAYHNQGISYFHNGEFDKAISDFTKAIELKPDYKSAYNNRGELRYKMGDYLEAVEDCSKAIELDPDGVQSESYYHRSLSYKALGGDENLKLALADAQRGLEVARRLGSRSLVEVKQFEDLIRELEGELKG